MLVYRLLIKQNSQGRLTVSFVDSPKVAEDDAFSRAIAQLLKRRQRRLKERLSLRDPVFGGKVDNQTAPAVE